MKIAHLPIQLLRVLFLCCIFTISLYLFFSSHWRAQEFRSSMTEIISGELNEISDEIDTYIMENVPKRELMIQVNNYLSYYLFNKSPLETVIKGEDNWLFYTNTVSDFDTNNQYSDTELESIVSYLVSMEEALSAQGISFYVLIAPNKNSIYPEYMPIGYVQDDEVSRIDELVQVLDTSTDVQVVYPKQALLDSKSDDLLYYKWDTHWNSRGASVGYNELMYSITGEEPFTSESLSFEEYSIDYGDMQDMLDISITGNDKNYLSNYLDSVETFEVLENKTLIEPIYDTQAESLYLCREQNYTDIITYQSNSENTEKLILFGDSFRVALIPYLSKSFSESIFVNSSVDLDLVNEEKPTIVVYELVERNILKILDFE